MVIMQGLQEKSKLRLLRQGLNIGINSSSIARHFLKHPVHHADLEMHMVVRMVVRMRSCMGLRCGRVHGATP